MYHIFVIRATSELDYMDNSRTINISTTSTMPYGSSVWKYTVRMRPSMAWYMSLSSKRSYCNYNCHAISTDTLALSLLSGAMAAHIYGRRWTSITLVTLQSVRCWWYQFPPSIDLFVAISLLSVSALLREDEIELELWGYGLKRVWYLFLLQPLTW